MEESAVWLETTVRSKVISTVPAHKRNSWEIHIRKKKLHIFKILAPKSIFFSVHSHVVEIIH